MLSHATETEMINQYCTDWILSPGKKTQKSGLENEGYPSRPGCVGKYTILKPSLFAADPVVSPIQATELFHFSGSGIRPAQALSK